MGAKISRRLTVSGPFWPSAVRVNRTRRTRQAVQRPCYISLETIAPLSDDPFVKLPAVAA
jgi:hypothetical protein